MNMLVYSAQPQTAACYLVTLIKAFTIFPLAGAEGFCLAHQVLKTKQKLSINRL